MRSGRLPADDRERRAVLRAQRLRDRRQRRGGQQVPMFGRGRLDHLALQAASLEAFDTIRDRLMPAAPATASSPTSGRCSACSSGIPTGSRGRSVSATRTRSPGCQPTGDTLAALPRCPTPSPRCVRSSCAATTPAVSPPRSSPPWPGQHRRGPGVRRRHVDGPAPTHRGRGLRTSRREGVPGGQRHGGQLAVARRALPAMGCGAVSRDGTHHSQRVRSDIDVLRRRRLHGLSGDGSLVDGDSIRDAFATTRWGDPHHSQPSVLSLTSPTDIGACIRSRTSPSLPPPRRNAGYGSISTAPASPTPLPPSGAACRSDLASRSRRVSLGATKNGALSTDAIVCFDPACGATRVSDQARRSRCVEDAVPVGATRRVPHRWPLASYRDARQHHDGASRRRPDELGVDLELPPEANMAYAQIDPAAIDRLEADGVLFYRMAPGTIRLVTSFPDDRRRHRRGARPVCPRASVTSGIGRADRSEGVGETLDVANVAMNTSGIASRKIKSPAWHVPFTVRETAGTPASRSLRK